MINEYTHEAYGVEYIRNRKVNKVYTKNEVILSSGAFNSPQLLILSGIGPKEHLNELGIPIIKDLRVGKNLQDHICFFGLTFTADPLAPSLNEDILLNNPNFFLQWINGKNLLLSLL